MISTGPNECPLIKLAPKVAIIVPYFLNPNILPFQPSPHESNRTTKIDEELGVRHPDPGHQVVKITLASNLPALHSLVYTNVPVSSYRSKET